MCCAALRVLGCATPCRSALCFALRRCAALCCAWLCCAAQFRDVRGCSEPHWCGGMQHSTVEQTMSCSAAHFSPTRMLALPFRSMFYSSFFWPVSVFRYCGLYFHSDGFWRSAVQQHSRTFLQRSLFSVSHRTSESDSSIAVRLFISAAQSSTVLRCSTPLEPTVQHIVSYRTVQ